VGSLEEYKGVVYLVKAMGKLKKEGVPTQLTIVGVGSLENKIRSIAKEQSVYDDITFKGYVQHGKELMKTFSDSDIFVLPSISSEGTPKVVMEAMSQALPVIATDIGSTSSMLEDGRNGILIKPKDSDAIAEALKKLINDKVLRTRYVKNGIDLAHRSTNEKQREIIKNAMLQNVSEIVGVPAYFSEMEQKIDGGL
jgi:glycosyltransferase involved in cell wall biosynthesis